MAIPADSNLRRALTITERVIPIRSAITRRCCQEQHKQTNSSFKIAETALISEVRQRLIAAVASCLFTNRFFQSSLFEGSATQPNYRRRLSQPDRDLHHKIAMVRQMMKGARRNHHHRIDRGNWSNHLGSHLFRATLQEKWSSHCQYQCFLSIISTADTTCVFF